MPCFLPAFEIGSTLPHPIPPSAKYSDVAGRGFALISKQGNWGGPNSNDSKKTWPSILILHPSVFFLFVSRLEAFAYISWGWG
jgi:hypothetical protein